MFAQVEKRLRTDKSNYVRRRPINFVGTEVRGNTVRGKLHLTAKLASLLAKLAEMAKSTSRKVERPGVSLDLLP